MIKKLYITVLYALFSAVSACAVSATHAYLSVPNLKELAQDSWGTEIKKYTVIIDQALDKELQYEGTHHVFYHAQKGELRIVQDFIKSLYSFLYPTTTIKDFYFLRAWYDFPKTIVVNTFIDTHEDGVPKEWNDNKKSLSKRMLSVNFSLFGNTKNYGKFGECSFKYFFSNKSIKAPCIEAILEGIFDDFGLNKKYIPQLIKINNSISTLEGSLFQIFVPTYFVDQIAFAAQRLGTPYRNGELMSDLFNKKKQRYLTLTPILATYCQDPQQFGMTLDRLQGRLLFSQDILLNPLSGVIIFRYTTIDPKMLKKYEHTLKKLTHKIFRSWMHNLPTTSMIFTLLSHSQINALQKHYENQGEL
jgi:hypothetical protein